MRCYHLNNFYCQNIMAGIQSAHAQHELMLKYLDPLNEEAKSPYHQPQIHSYLEWARNHKTIIVLNAGMQSDLQSWVEFLAPLTHPYAWARFHEAEEALNGALTNVAVVLPERIYAFSRQITSAIQSGRSYDLINTDTTYVSLVPRAGGEFKLVRKSRELVTDEFVENPEEWNYTKYDIELMSRLSKCGLM